MTSDRSIKIRSRLILSVAFLGWAYAMVRLLPDALDATGVVLGLK
jgi:hypothetical protein